MENDQKNLVCFEDREEAFLKLYDELINHHLAHDNSIVLSTSFAGLFLADRLASKLDSGLDMLFCAPVIAPANNECEIATVSENMDLIINEPLIDSFGISLDYVYGEAKRAYEEIILPRIYKFRKGATLSELGQKNVFLIDQGVETGITMDLAIKTCIQKKAKSIYVLSPTIPYDIATILSRTSDVLVAVYKPRYFVSTSHYYKSLDPISEEEALTIMDKYIAKPNLIQKGS